MLRTKSFRLTLLSVCGFAFASVLAAQTNVGIVNTQLAILKTAEIQKAQDDMQKEFKPRQDEIQKLQRQLQDLQGELQRMQGKLTIQAQQNLQIKGQRLQRDIKRKTEDLRADVDNKRNAVLRHVQKQMLQVIQKLAQQKGLDVIIDVANTVYYKPALDLTQEATAAYDKAYPVAQQPQQPKQQTKD